MTLPPGSSLRSSPSRVNIFARVPPAPSPSHPLLDRLWNRYIEEVPHAAVFAKLHGAVPFKNDHIALRSLGIAPVAAVFERLGWKQAGEYAFPDVHLRAVHLSKPDHPRIFISELIVDALPAEARELITRYAIDTTPPPSTSFDALASWFRAPRPAPESAIEEVAKSSQYGAWLLAFGRKVNHFTASVDDIELWQLRLLQAGVPMKSQIEGAPGSKLRQTATKAASVDVPVAGGGKVRMPYAYFEIAQRANGFDGFLAPQARQLFDMTQPAVVVEEVQEPYKNQRTHSRVDAVVAVEAAWAEGRARLIAFTSNISLGGVFLTNPDRGLPDVGSPIRLIVDLVERGRYEVRGVVKWKLGTSGVGVAWLWDSTSDPGYVALSTYLASVQ